MANEVLCIETSNPFFEGRNAIYLIKSKPVTMIDSGVATQRAYDSLVDGLAQLGLSVGDIGTVILTHKHIDHIGNAWRIQQQAGAEVFIHESEVEALADVDAQGERFAALVEERLKEWHVPRRVRNEESKMPPWEIEPVVAQGLSDSEQISIGDTKLTVIHTPGHTLGSICLEYDGRLFTGDHVLPDISPNVGAGDLRRRGLLQHFLDSLDKISAYGPVMECLPGHGRPFTNLSERCRQLTQHHQDRLDRILDILGTEAMTVYEVAGGLFGTMKDFHVVLGCAEAYAHLEYLETQHRVTRHGSRFRRSM